MYAKIQKWGNSQALRLPKAILEKVELKENDKVEIEVHEGTLIIKPLKKRRTLEERIAEYQGEYQCGEWDTGKPVGNEEL